MSVTGASRARPGDRPWGNLNPRPGGYPIQHSSFTSALLQSNTHSPTRSQGTGTGPKSQVLSATVTSDRHGGGGGEGGSQQARCPETGQKCQAMRNSMTLLLPPSRPHPPSHCHALGYVTFQDSRNRCAQSFLPCPTHSSGSTHTE